MNAHSILLRLLIVTAGLILPPSSFADIEWRLSVKLILDANSQGPDNASGLVTESTVSALVTKANEWLAGDGRGYQLRLDEVVTVSGLSDWFDVAVNADNRRSLDHEVTRNAESKSRYAYAENAVNIYINDRTSGQYFGYCAFPPGDDIILLRADAGALTLLHECGHYFDLYHTHQGESGCEGNCGCGDTLRGGNNDQIDDTIADHECWTCDGIAQAEFGANYANLTASQQRQVDKVCFNLMSYHSTTDPVITSDQWDRWTDTANGSRDFVATGHTWFVDGASLSTLPTGSSAPFFDAVNSTWILGPFRTVTEGKAAASGGDIVLLRPGTYTDTTLFKKSLTFRATRGSATLRAP